MSEMTKLDLATYTAQKDFDRTKAKLMSDMEWAIRRLTEAKTALEKHGEVDTFFSSNISGELTKSQNYFQQAKAVIEFINYTK